MYDIEFRPAVKAIHVAARGVLGGAVGASEKLRAEISRHLYAVQGFNKLTASGDEIRARLVRNCQIWQADSAPAENGDKTTVARNICDDAKWFADLY